jgi:hypothetical protein
MSDRLAWLFVALFGVFVIASAVRVTIRVHSDIERYYDGTAAQLVDPLVRAKFDGATQ